MPIATSSVRPSVRTLLVAAAVLGALGLFGCGSAESNIDHTSGTGNTTGASNAGGAGGTAGGPGSTTGGGDGATSGTGGTGGTTSGADGTTSATGGTGGTTRGTGGTGGATQHFEGASTAAEMCETLPGKLADYQARCRGGTPEEWRLFSDNPCAATARSEAAGRISFDADRAQECLRFLATDDCSFQAGKKNPCNSFVTGSIAEEEPCEDLGFGDECAPGLFCGYVEDCIGRCRTYAQVDENCHGNLVTAECAPGLECDGPSAVCLVPGAAGEACAGDGLCEAGHYCEREDGEPGTCRPVKTEGTCPGGVECAPGFKCLDSGSAERNCVRIKAAGEACTFGLRECERYCSFEGACRVVAHEDEPCGSLRDSPLIQQPSTGDPLTESANCAAGLVCDQNSDSRMQGICRPQAIVGEDCPATRITGSPCLMGDEITYCSDSDDCVSCGPTD